MLTWEVPGVALAIIKDGIVVKSRGYGVREIGQNTPVDEHTIFAVASNTKSFTATALAMLVDAGKLSWDDPIIDPMPEFALYDAYVTRHITTRDFLAHRSGLAGYAADHLWQGSSYSRQEIIQRIRYQIPAGEFRVHFGYSNVLYLAAGQLTEAVAGIPWDDFIRNRILDPLGMTESTTSVPSLENEDNLAIPHIKIDGAVQTVPRYDTRNVAPAAGLNTSVRDMSSFTFELGYDCSRAYENVEVDVAIYTSRDPDLHFQATNHAYGQRMDFEVGEGTLRVTLNALQPQNTLGMIVVAIWDEKRTEQLFWWRVPVEFEGVDHATAKNFVPVEFELEPTPSAKKIKKVKKA